MKELIIIYGAVSFGAGAAVLAIAQQIRRTYREIKQIQSKTRNYEI